MKPVSLALQTLKILFTHRLPRNETLQAIVTIGVESLPIIVISTAFAGVVVTYEMAWHMDRALQSVSLMPGFSGQFILRELGIVIPALLIVSKVGAAMTAEVATMKVTEQIDALRLLGINPVAYLVAPRLLASLLASVSMALVASFVTLVCAMGVATQTFHFTPGEYLNAVQSFVGGSDLMCALVKSAAFGFVIPIISCSHGFRAEPGAQGVGEATTQSVVDSTLAIIVLDFLITFLFTQGA